MSNTLHPSHTQKQEEEEEQEEQGGQCELAATEHAGGR